MNPITAARMKPLMWDDFLNLVDSHRKSAVSSNTFSIAQTQVVIAKSDVESGLNGKLCRVLQFPP